MEFEQKLNEYARLAVVSGMAVKPGQDVLISASVDAAQLVRLVAKQAYAAGAGRVEVEWSAAELTRMRYGHCTVEQAGECPPWVSGLRNEMAARGAAFLSIRSDDPAALAGVDPRKPAAAQKGTKAACGAFYEGQRSGTMPWCIIGAAGPKWAKTVFPRLGEQEAVEKLWETIFKTVRVDGGDAVQAWENHRRSFEKRIQWLNGQNFTELRYRNSIGTDITVGLPEHAVWNGGGCETADGRWHFPNMPTEEIFTAPHRERVNGTVHSAMPLNHGGSLIDDFYLTFRDGRVVDFDAKVGREVLQSILDADEGARYLGECALVPHASPISEMGILFYNTLYDENASCHFALGRGVSEAIEGGMRMSREELAARGINDSVTHVDFMLGTADLSITGVRGDGTQVPVFLNGNWAD